MPSSCRGSANSGLACLIHSCRSGFSAIEVLIGILVASSIAGFALLNMQSILPGIRANEAMNQVLSQLRQARNMAVAQRRSIQLHFENGNRIRLVRNEWPLGNTDVSTVSLSNGFQFLIHDGVPDTPDQFGNGSAVDFGEARSLTFQNDGRLVNQSGEPVNGTVYIGLPGDPDTQRAVTILGATGRIRSYRFTGTHWVH